MILMLITFLIMSAVISSTAALGSASRVGNGVGPNTTPMKNAWKSNAAHCSVECELTPNCASFSFGEDKCSLFNEQYTTESGVIERKPSVNYYYYTKGKTSISHQPVSVKTNPTTTTAPELQYELITETANFQQARDNCTQLGGQLACIHSQDTNEILKEKLNAEKNDTIGAWIGLKTKGTGGTFEWEDNSTIFYSKIKNARKGFQTWIKGNPEDYDKGFACVQILPRDFKQNMGKWADENSETCSKQLKYYFCEKRS